MRGGAVVIWPGCSVTILCPGRWRGLKLSSRCPSEGPSVSCSSCWDVPSLCMTNTGHCSSSSSTSSRPSHTASRGGSWTTPTQPATPVKSWPYSSRRASSSQLLACPSSLHELKLSLGGHVRSSRRAILSFLQPSWASFSSSDLTTTLAGSSGKPAE